MSGLVFEERAPVLGSAPNRADVACFIGFVRRRPGVVLPRAVRGWLDDQGWTAPPYQQPAATIEALTDLPVPLEAWYHFDRLFAWEDSASGTYLGAAVRSFFVQGGRKCYLIRVGDPIGLDAPRTARLAQVQALLPGYPRELTASPVDRSSWHGVGHLFGLTDVSLLAMPDLPSLVADDRPMPLLTLPPVRQAAELFIECSTNGTAHATIDAPAAHAAAPRCDEAGYADWARAIELIVLLLARRAREVQLVAAVPLPRTGTRAAGDLMSMLARRNEGPLALAPGEGGIASAFVQLTYPWLKTRGSLNLPEQLESPEGVLVGVLADSALRRGAFRSVARLSPPDVFAVVPVLSRSELQSSVGEAPHTLLERASIFGPTPGGLQLLSDATASLNEAYRPAAVNRLVSIVARATRRLGEGLTFESSNEALWARVRARLSELLLGLLADGALRGTTPAEAFVVRCDRTTMRQTDLDNGRVVAEVVFDAAAPIQQIHVTLILNDAGVVSIQPSQPASTALVAA